MKYQESSVFVSDLHVSFGRGRTRTQAVCGVSFETHPGSIVALLGSNGAGKSTTLHVLTTLLRPDRGIARVCGHDVVSDAHLVRRCIGVALQATGLAEGQTVEAMFMLHGRLSGLGGRASGQRADELCQTFGLDAYRRVRVSKLSGGNRRRVDLALALITRPPVLFLDEPTTGLDVRARQAVWAEIERLREAQTTIILTTQYLEEADRLADHVVIIDRGRVVAKGRPSELKRRISREVVELALPTPVTREEAEALFGSYVTLENGAIRVPTDDSARTVREIFDVTAARGIAFKRLTVSSPTLDDVFLELTQESAHEQATLGESR